MPFMLVGRTLRKQPNGDKTDDSLEPGDQVEILEESQGWAKVKLNALEGWVASTAIGDQSPVPPDPNIDAQRFFRQCWREGLSSEVIPHYLAAVAQLRSGIKGDTQNNLVGPYRFSEAEWNAGRKDEALKLTDFRLPDMKQWDFQITMFAALTARDLAALTTLLTRPPSAHELYLASLIGPKAAAAAIKDPAITIQAALTGVADGDLPIGGMTRDQIQARHAKYLLDPGPPPAPAKASVALDRIATDLQAAVDAVKDGIVAAGTEVLGTTPEVEDLLTDPKAPGAGGGPAGPLPDLPLGSGPAGVVGAGGPLGQMISKGEGGYGSFNRGIAGDARGKQIDFSSVALSDIMALQRLPPGNGKRLFAVGKYQVIPKTMRGAVAALGINTSEMYGPALQEKIFRNYLIAAKRPAVKKFVTGQSNDLHGAQLALALEFASVADPNTGRSHYGGSGGNRASISVAQTAAALQAEKAKYQQKISSGLSPNDAWNALST
jgi:hypothetical protein